MAAGEKVFGDLTNEELATGIKAELYADGAIGFFNQLVDAAPGSPESATALEGLLMAQSEGDIKAHVAITRARLMERQKRGQRIRRFLGFSLD